MSFFANHRYRILLAIVLSFVVRFAAVAQRANLSPDSLLVQLLNHTSPDTSRVMILIQLAFVNAYANPINTFKYSLEAKKLSDGLNFTRGQADACRGLGMAYFEHGNIPTSLNYFLEGLRIAELNHYRQTEADITGNIGTAYNSLGNPTEALTFLNRARQMQRRLLNYLRESAVLNNMGDSYLALKQYDKAREAYSTAYDYSIHHNFKLGVTTNLRNLGNVLEQTGQYDSALSNYLKCIRLSEEMNDNRGYILSCKSIASVLLQTKKITEAQRYTQIALDRALNSQLRGIIRDLYQLMYQISEQQKDQTRSFDYFKSYVAYKDSVQDTRVDSEVAMQRLRFESSKKEAEIKLLKKDSDLQSEQIAIRNTQLVFTIVVGLLAALFLWVSFRSFSRIKEKNNLLKQKNDEVQEQHFKIQQQRDELITLNEELRAQQEEVMSQRDALTEKNRQIQRMSRQVADVNNDLGKLVAERTQMLEDQNTKLTGYAFLNAHKLRAPLARIMGLVNLLQLKKEAGEKTTIMTHLVASSEELNDVANSISQSIQDQLDAEKKSRESQ